MGREEVHQSLRHYRLHSTLKVYLEPDDKMSKDKNICNVQ